MLWDEDYTKYEAMVTDVPTLRDNFDYHFNPKYFKNASLIKNETHLINPEDLAITKDGLLYTGLFDGSIVSVKEGSN